MFRPFFLPSLALAALLSAGCDDAGRTTATDGLELWLRGRRSAGVITAGGEKHRQGQARKEEGAKHGEPPVGNTRIACC